MSLYAFGSGMLEQGLENQKVAAERQYEAIKELKPMIEKKLDMAVQNFKLETINKKTLGQYYTANEINLLSTANNNILRSDDPETAAKLIIDKFGGNDSFKQRAANSNLEEYSSGSKEEIDYFSSLYRKKISSTLGIGESTVNLITGNNTVQNDQASTTETPVEQPMVDPEEVSADPIFRDVAFQKEYKQTPDKDPEMAPYFKFYTTETGSDLLVDKPTFDNWMMSEAKDKDGVKLGITNKERVDNTYTDFRSPLFDSTFTIAKNAEEVAKEQEEAGVNQTRAIQYQMSIEMAISQGNQQLADALTQQAEDEGIDLDI
tara:strand:- start:1381 stop:2334 length:954 start_codon:yes stop_codon:yes gene_type:complete